MMRFLSATVLLLATTAGIGCSRAASAPPPEKPMVDGPALRKELAFALAGHREWSAASRQLIALIAQRPHDPELHTLIGTVYREQSLFEQAERAYATAIRLDPKMAGAYAGRGILREVRGDGGDAALEDFRIAIRLRPSEGAYANNLGVALYVRGRYRDAEAALQEGLRQDPFSRRMRNNLGFVYGKLRQFDRAKREFDHGGSDDEAENNLGYAYEQAGDVRAACALYRHAASENPLLRAASENAQRACPPGGREETKTP
ncbi:tetratricopeptide repeat protein [Pendulispora albinea]|uniref:Tetratricopeptide repeat protein n=1 Tax=Pendulispora albinea TaxID=2741071 RepID=A0ABZ2LT11_9BACT